MTLTQEEKVRLRSEWVKALRGGKYKQGKKALHRFNTFCCLGAACEVFDGMYPGVLARTRHGSDEQYDGNGSAVCDVVKNALGLKTKVGEYREYGEDVLKYLVIDNDSGVPFTTIADTIESDPPGLFVEDEP